MNNRFKKIILLLLAVIFIFLYAHRIVLFLEKKAAWHSLKEECIEKITNFKGQAHIVIIDLTQDWRFTYQDKDKVPAASIIKIPIMVSCFLADKEGKISIDDDIVLKQSDKAGGVFL